MSSERRPTRSEGSRRLKYGLEYYNFIQANDSGENILRNWSGVSTAEIVI